MDVGKFYFISDEYYVKFKDCGLLENKELVNGKPHGRPCYYSFKDDKTNLYWMIPISSKVSKYEKQYDIAIKKYNICDGISFGYILGEKRAILIQNMFPVTEQYIDNMYINPDTNQPIEIPKNLKAEINAKIRKAIRLYRRGIKIVLSNTIDIESQLLQDSKELLEIK